MSRTSFRQRRGDVSESDSEVSSVSRPHRYNTRYSEKVCKSWQPFQRPSAKCFPSPAASSQIRFEQGLNDLNSWRECTPPRMDYCYDPCPPPRRDIKKYFGGFLKLLGYLLLIAGAIFIPWALLSMHSQIKEIQKNIDGSSGSVKGRDPQEKLFKELNKKYSDALKKLLQDPVGRADFALESSGGRILSTTGNNYMSTSKKFFGFSFTTCDGGHGPSAMIRAISSPGECWAFEGNKASAVIKLIGHVKVDSVTIEHIPPMISPTGNINSAPKDFKIWGLLQPKQPKEDKVLLGEFQYDVSGSPLQTFKIDNNSTFYKYIEFEVLSNHGNAAYTCVYRIRVHGKLE